MAKHLLCVTIDTDPDGLNTHDPDRRNLNWEGLHFAMQHFHEALPHIPLTWYVRADGQLEHAYGSMRYLLDEHRDFWQKAIQRGDELGWHPHLYTVPRGDEQPTIITDSAQAVTELTRIWEGLQGVDLPMPTFRMGEAWHTPETLNLLEKVGFSVDSTAIPGRDDSASGHPRNWSGAPNHPYYPAWENVREAGEMRQLLEVPMNSWYFQASYDRQPKLRYMNPCIHADLWQQALDRWQTTIPQQALHTWVLILHPGEAMPQPPDLLYAHSLETMVENLHALEQKITAQGDDVQWVTVASAAQQWREQAG